MKRLLILLLLMALVPSLIFAANEGVGILFDNSGSMRIYFTSEMLADAEKAVMDLVINGTYEKGKWSMESEGDDYKNRPDKKLWQPGAMVYVHAFGEIKKTTDPFFKVAPEYGEHKTENEARQFIRRELLNKLDYKDNFTNYELARNLCWMNLCNQLGSGGKNYYMNVLIISDFEVDLQSDYAGVGDYIKDEFIKNNAAEAPLFRLVHNGRGRQKNPGFRLAIQLYRIGPHFIKPTPSPAPATPTGPGTTPVPSDDRIILKTPKSNSELDPEKQPNIKFTWDAKGNFEKYIVEIHTVKPKRKILVRETRSKQAMVPAKILVSRMKSSKADRLVWFVKGVYPEESKTMSLTSNRFFLKEASGGGGAFWIFLLILLLIAAAVFALPKIIDKVKARPRGETGGGTEGEGGETAVDDEDDWSKDL